MKLAALCVLLLGCQSGDKAAPRPEPQQLTAAACKPFLVKARFVLKEMGSAAGMNYSEAIEDQAIRDCEAEMAKGTAPSTLMRCVLSANTTDGVRACFPTYDQVMHRGSGT